MHQTFTPRLLTALLAVAFAGGANAAGFQLLEQNASGVGNAYAGSAAVAENASTVYFNPAGMTQLRDREISVGATAVNTSFEFNNGASATGALAGDGDNGGGLGVIPNAYMSWALSKDIYVGLGIGAPFGMKTEYDEGWTGAAQSLMFEIKTININPSIAWRANDWLSLGFGLNWQKLDAEYIRSVGVTNVPGVVNVAGATATLKLSDDAWGWNAGALFTLSPATKLGLSYRSTIKYQTTGKVSVASNGDPTAAGTVAALNAAGASSDTKASIKLPDTFILSGSHKFNSQWEALGDISWTGWSSIPKVDILRTSGLLSGTTAQTLDTDFRDTWRVALGANYTVNDAWKLKFGVAYDQTPTKAAETRLVSMPDNDRVWLSLGTQWKPSKTSALDVGAAYLFVKDADIDNDQRSAVVTQNRGLVNGTYNDSAWILGAQYSMSF